MKLSEHPLVSILTPVYNGEKYLAECIESVLAQTYENWEYIIINNCSTDSTLKIVQKYAERDTRIHIHNNEQFLNILQNHNHAFRQISPESKYCKVLQADDWLFPECIAKMVEVAESNPTVGIVGSYRLEETRVTCDGLPYQSTVVSGREICRSTLLGGPYLFGSPTTLLIRSDMIRARKSVYNERNLHADNEACYDILKESDFGFVHQVLSYTRRHNETETTSARRLNTYILGDLIILKKYGPLYLNDNEFKLILNERLKDYYRFLAKVIFKMGTKEVWDYHKNGLRELEHPISVFNILRTACVVLYNRLLDTLKVR